MTSDQSRRRAVSGDTGRETRGRTKRLSRRQMLGSITAFGSLTLAGCQSLQKRLGLDPVWERDIERASAAGPPAVVDDHLLVGGQDKVFHAFTVDDGTEEFGLETGGPIDTRPAVPESGGPYHVRSTDGDVYTVSQSGELLWQREGLYERGTIGRAGQALVEFRLPRDRTAAGFDARTGDQRFERRVSHYQPTGLTSNRLIVQVPEGETETRVVALSLGDGEVQWQTDAGPAYPVVISDEDLTVIERNSVVTARDPRDGSVQWRTSVDEIDRYRTHQVGQHVYFTQRQDSTAELVALNRQSGEVAWRAPAGYQLGAVESTGDAVFVGSQIDDPDGGTLGRVDCYEPDGTKRWELVTDAPEVETLVVTGEYVIASSERELTAIDPADGTTAWQYAPDSHSRLGLAVADDHLFVSHLDRGVVASLPTT